ncbi:MAG: DUF4263 domain-containing protein [Bacteroidetes bacterium]|nr:DUF4263 domain-containing protein [Bacteroidota bacterium]
MKLNKLVGSASTEGEIISNHTAGYLYSHDFGGGRFFQTVFQDEDSIQFRIATRTMIKVVYLKEKDDLEGLEIIKTVGDDVTEKIKLSKFNIEQIKIFLDFISQLDFKSVVDRKLKLLDSDELDALTIGKIKALLNKEGGADVIETLVEDGLVTSKDIINTSFRKKQLGIFNRLLNEPDFWKQYAKESSIDSSKEEKVWQHFFSQNEWIFGYGLDYRYCGILQKEFSASNTQADGKGEVITDFLLGDTRFATFVEIKKPTTPLFASALNRSGAWQLSRELIDGISQVLEQKASGQIKIESGTLYDARGEVIKQNAYDSKVILIIGNLSRTTYVSPLEQQIKNKTFELFRRDSRNVKVMTYDELYDRAQFIVEHRQPK